MLPIYLTIEELREITGRVKYSAQIRYLRSQGFTVIPRADGRPLVSRSHFETMMGGEHFIKKYHEHNPDFSSFYGTQST